MAAYWHQPDVTAAVLMHDGWLRTGDAADRDPEGYVFLHDRLKDVIISGGESVYPVAVPHERWGATVKAVVVRRPGASLTFEEVLAFACAGPARSKCPTSRVARQGVKKDLRARDLPAPRGLTTPRRPCMSRNQHGRGPSQQIS